MTARAKVTFEPSGSFIHVECGTLVLEAARRADVLIPAMCAGRGVCGSCAVRVLEGALGEQDPMEKLALRSAPEAVRLACKARVVGDVRVRVLGVPESPEALPEVQGGAVLAVDLGTTTVACTAVSVAGDVTTTSAPNRQMVFGAEVISRIMAAIDGEGPALRDAAVRSILDAVANAGIDSASVQRVVIAGNSTMSALLAGADVASLGAFPFSAPPVPSALGASHPLVLALRGATVELVPGISSFIGGDTTAGLWHSGMLDGTATELFVDLGTNAEIALVHGGRLWVASAAAGPAFEGVGVSCGGPAIPGAITSVRWTEDGGFSLSTIDDVPPVWFTGAGLISAMAECRRAGMIRADGAIDLDAAAARVGDEGVASIVFGNAERLIELTQLDIRTLQLAKAAVRVAIEQVLDAGRVAARMLDTAYVAGAFGAAVRADDLTTLGIMPRGAEPVVRYLGNASLQGAVSLVSQPETAASLAPRVTGATHINLAEDPSFERSLLLGLALEPFDS